MNREPYLSLFPRRVLPSLEVVPLFNSYRDFAKYVNEAYNWEEINGTKFAQQNITYWLTPNRKIGGMKVAYPFIPPMYNEAVFAYCDENEIDIDSLLESWQETLTRNYA